MSEVARQRSGWVFGSTSPEAVGAMENAAAAAEIAVRAAAGIMGVRVLTVLVRDHPLLSLVLASGIGYMLGHEWRVGRGQATSVQDR